MPYHDFTREQKNGFKHLLAQGWSVEKIAMRFNCSVDFVKTLIDRTTTSG